MKYVLVGLLLLAVTIYFGREKLRAECYQAIAFELLSREFVKEASGTNEYADAVFTASRAQNRRIGACSQMYRWGAK